MGLFDFASNIGNKVFGGEDDPSVKITEALVDADLGIANINAVFDDGVVTLTGDTDDNAAVGKAILIAGNMEGVSQLVNNMSLEIAADITPEVEYYEIQSGDTLSKLAATYYGDPAAYMQIFEANREVIGEPDLIFVGQKIRIPQQA